MSSINRPALTIGDRIVVLRGDHALERGVYKRAVVANKVLVCLDSAPEEEVVLDRDSVMSEVGDVVVPREVLFRVLDDLEELSYHVNDMKQMLLTIAKEQN